MFYLLKAVYGGSFWWYKSKNYQVRIICFIHVYAYFVMSDSYGQTDKVDFVFRLSIDEDLVPFRCFVRAGSRKFRAFKVFLSNTYDSERLATWIIFVVIKRIITLYSEMQMFLI